MMLRTVSTAEGRCGSSSHLRGGEWALGGRGEGQEKGVGEEGEVIIIGASRMDANGDKIMMEDGWPQRHPP